MFCANCGEKIDDGAKFCMKCGTATPQAGPIQQSPAGKRNTLLLISAIIGSVFCGFLIIGGIFVAFSGPNEEISDPNISLMQFLPFIAVSAFILATILTFSAWTKNKKSYARIGGILYIISIYGIVSAILNFVAYSQLKKQEKE